MSTIYSHLSEEESNVKKESKGNSRTESEEPQLRGIKIAVGGAFFLSVVALIGSILLFQSVNAERGKREALEEEQVRLRENAERFEEESERYRTEMERMREQLKSYASSRRSLNEELEGSRIQISDLRRELRSFGGGDSTRSVGMGTFLPSTTRERSAGVSTESDPFNEVTQAIEEVGVMMDDADVAAEPVAKEPQVMTINRKFNFIVVNIGLQDQIKIGDHLVVERDGTYIGAVEVEKLYDKFASATIVEEARDSKIQEGDDIKKPF